jgi:PAS domain S-box-containing protein
MNANESKQLDKGLGDSPNLLAGIIGSAMDGIITIDDAQRIVLFNAAAERIFACPANEAIGSSVERFIPQRFRAAHSRRLRRFAESGATHRTFQGLGTLWGLRATGEEFPIEASISKAESGGKNFFTAVLRDITERIRSEEALRKSKERFRLAAQAGGMFAYEWDAATDLITRSPESAHILGINEAVPITGQQVLARVHPDDRERLKDAVAALSPEKPDLHVSYRMIRPDNTVIWIERSSCGHFDKQGKLLRIVGMMADITERHRTEETVRESEQRFRLVADTAPALMWMSGTDKLCNYFNKPWLDFTGRSMEEELGNGWAEGVHPDDLQRCLDTYMQSFDRREKFKMEYRLRHHDGEYRWILDIGVPRLNQDGSFAGYIGIGVDVTDRKHAEHALRESEERLRLAQQAARIGAFEWNIRTGVNTWTPELEAMYGLPPGGFGGTQTTFENLIHPDDRARVIELDNWALKTGQPTTGEWRVVWPDGSVHWIAGRWQVLMSEFGGPSRMIGVNIEVTESKRREQALQEMNRTLETQAALLQSREELLRVFVKNVPAAVAMLDRDMRYLQVSDRWCSDYLPGRAEILGRSHYEIFPDMPERWKDVHRRALQGETLRADEDRWDGQDGTHWARWEVRPWKTAEGAVGGILILAEDITRRKQVEEALADMTRKLIAAQEQERVRIGRELHDDINQKVALLAVELERLRENPSEIQPRVKELLRQTVEISDDVQALSHDLHSSKLEYLGVVAGMKSWCREFAERQRMEIDFKSDVPSAVPLEIGLCLFRVLQEALNNAIRHGEVRWVDVQLREDSGEIHLAISDMGRGFDVEAALQGKGLGLTSMRERVRLVNGTIAIESKPNGGTTIRVRVPLGSEKLFKRAVG